jgi:hypothetical protein
MSLVSIDTLPAGAKTWIFGASRDLDGATSAIRTTMERFIDEWTAHGSDLPAAFEIVEDRFLVVAADESGQPGGCSIDRLFSLLRAFERDLGVAMLDSTQVFYRDSSGNVRSATRSEFRKLASTGDVTGETVVFDTSIDRLSAFREGNWCGPAAASWHGRAFGLT